MNDDNVIDLRALGEALRKYKFQILASSLVLSAVVFAATSLVPPQWETSALLRVGQSNSNQFEVPENLAARLKSPAFIQGFKRYSQSVAEPMGVESFGLLVKSFRATKIKESDLVEIKLRAYSAEQCRRIVEDMLVYMRQAQKPLYEDTMLSLKERENEIVKELPRAKLLVSALDRQLRESKSANERVFVSVLLQQKIDEIKGMEARVRTLREQMSPLRTFETRVEGGIYISENYVYPKTILVTVLAFMFSLLMGMGVAYFIHRRNSTSVAEAG